jgi:hypothetical protein
LKLQLKLYPVDEGEVVPIPRIVDVVLALMYDPQWEIRNVSETSAFTVVVPAP